ncbi:cupin domain-containing protein [Polynucleobacter paneuropaeus]|nr:cupin domain-containing protein [Polynucleobacter paneuropaeus]
MKVFNLDDMTKGWFVGNFTPTVLATNQVEVGVKQYQKGDYECRHYHKVATEITVIISGKVRMNDQIYSAGDILVIPPGESTDFEVLEKVTTVVVKYPGAQNDKYIGKAS